MALLTGCHLLLVDDDPDTADLHRFVLTAQGAHVVVAQSVDDALLALERERIDVLVADISMPSADGFELLREVHARRPRMPAIAVSAFGAAEMRPRALAAGFLDYLAKPLPPMDLVRAARAGCAASGTSGAILTGA